MEMESQREQKNIRLLDLYVYTQPCNLYIFIRTKEKNESRLMVLKTELAIV